ncbi:MAG: FAD-binding oxidoreductase [Planctomycetes bacterium]|nr:FAD-binding oxidoreductase [Planctomycetota bacterium]
MVAELPTAFCAALKDSLGERFDRSAVGREAYARDLSTLGHLGLADALDGASPPPFAQPPQGIARVTSVEEVQAVTRLCREHSVPLIPFGAGSGVCGGILAIRGGITLDLKGLADLEIDHRSLLITVGPGYNLQLLEDRLQREGLTLGHYPSSITCSTIGGAVAARGAGQLSTRYGKVEDMVVTLDVVLSCGTRVSTGPKVPRAATGPDWAQLFTGSEGVLGTITSCTLRVHRLPALRLFRSYSFPTLELALESARLALQRGVRPAALRLYDPLDTLLVARSKDAPPLAPTEKPVSGAWPLSLLSLRGLKEALGRALPDLKEHAERALLSKPEWINSLTATLPGVGCLMILTFEGEPSLARAEEALFDEVAKTQSGVAQGPESAERWWRNRISVSFKQSGVYAMGGFVDTMEVATSWSRLMELHDSVRAALSPHALVMAHFSHAYAEGCSIYFTFAALRDDPAATRERYEACWREGLAAAVAAGACVSHHHGIGLLKGEALRAAQGDLHSLVFQPIKSALDPSNLLNPGKLGLP